MRLNKGFIFSVFLLVFIVGFLVFVFATDGAFISTDKPDYSPNETVLISGEGFSEASESTPISLQIIRPNGDVHICPDETWCPDLLPTTSSFSDYAYQLDGIEGTYTIDADDGTNFITQTFTDCPCGGCPTAHCGNGWVEIGEQCELPDTNNNIYCGQSTWECSGAKLGIRDHKGNCNSDCSCVPDSFTYQCVKWQCGATCDAQHPCTGGKTCNTNTCQCETPTPICGDGQVNGNEQCDDGNQVNGDGCNNDCTYSCTCDANCNDQSACTNDVCNLGTHVCQHNAITCNDNSVCTTDTCDPATGCLFAPISCDDQNTCTTDSCDALLGCKHANIGECSSGSDCQSGQCNMEKCQCVPVINLGCQYDSDCADADICNGQETCFINPTNGQGTCQPGTPLTCNDQSLCTTDTCNPSTGCVFTPKVCNTPPSQCYGQGSCNPDNGNCNYVFSDTTGPVTSDLISTKLIGQCKINIQANVSDTCSNIAAAEYFLDGSGCPDENTRGTPMDAKDESFDSKNEAVVANNILVSDGSFNIYVRGKDAAGKWGDCQAIRMDADCIPPDYPTCGVLGKLLGVNGLCGGGDQLVCGENPTIGANICDSESRIQMAEYFIDQNCNDPNQCLNWHGINMSASDGSYDESCEDVEAIVNLAPLSEGTHYVQLHGKDGQENWGKFIMNPIASFIKDTTPPKTDKTLYPADKAIVQCHGSEAGDANVAEKAPNGLTDGCAYVKAGTTVTLSANDFNPDNNANGGYNKLTGEYADKVKIHWNVWYKLNQGDVWTLDQSGIGNENADVTITLNKDSYHLIEYWSTDACNWGETHHYELDIVDTQAPETEKEVGTPKVAGDNNPVNYYITQQTQITLSCSDPQPHPVNDVSLKYKYRFNTDCADLEDSAWSNWMEYDGTIYFREDSCHELEYYCVDALGNEEQHHTEIDVVDTKAPVITKTIIGPSHGTCPPNTQNDICYIDGVTQIQVAATDPQPHPVGGITCDWSYTVDGGNSIIGATGVSAPFTINFPEESSHQLTITCRDALGNTATDIETFLVDKTPPVTTKSYGQPFYSLGGNFEHLGNGVASWTTEQFSTGTHSAKLSVVDGTQDWAGVDIPVDIPLNEINSLTFQELIKEYNPHGYNVNVILGVDADGNGDFKVDLPKWHGIGGTMHQASDLNGDTFIEMDGVTSDPTTGVWTLTNAYNTPQWWTTNAGGNGLSSDCYETLPNIFSSGCVDKMPTLDSTDHVKLIKLEIGGSGSWNNEIAYVDNVVLNGNIILNEPSASIVDWITSDTLITLTIDDAGPHKSGIKETYYRYMKVSDEACRDQQICQGLPEIQKEYDVASPKLMDGDSFSFTIPEDSCHLIEYYSVDNVQKTEAVKKQCVFVDNTAPETTKNLLGVVYVNDSKTYINGNTQVELTCADQLPHPVGGEEIYYRYFWNEQWTNWNEYTEPFSFLEDSRHDLQYYCVDALGNAEQPQSETDYVDLIPPSITIWNPTLNEASDVERCSQSVVVQVSDLKSGVNESSIYAELYYNNGTAVLDHKVALTKSIYGTYEGLMDKQLPAGNYVLKIFATDNVGNQQTVTMKEYLNETVFVEYIDPAYCNVNSQTGGSCDFTFHVCMRGDNNIQFWMNKLGDIITPDMMDATISHGNSDAFVGLKHGSFTSDAELLPLECQEINGRTSFILHLNFNTNVTQSIGPGVHDIDYTIESSTHPCVV